MQVNGNREVWIKLEVNKSYSPRTIKFDKYDENSKVSDLRNFLAGWTKQEKGKTLHFYVTDPQDSLPMKSIHSKTLISSLFSKNSNKLEITCVIKKKGWKHFSF